MTASPSAEKKPTLSGKFLVLMYTGIALSFAVFYFFTDLQMARNSTAGLVKKALKGKTNHLTAKSLSAWQKKALLQVEDPKFYEHKGVDFSTPGAGATTMTQSLVKWMYFKDFKPGFAKIKQTLIARFALHTKVSKDKQLTLYLNLAYLGHHKGQAVRGFQKAAQVYFKKDFQKLTQKEYLSLVAMLIAPNRYHILEHPKVNLERVQRIQRLLAGKCRPQDWKDVEWRACKGK